jgi:hypothetical protein
MASVARNVNMNFREHWVQRGQHRIYAREYAGADPAIILMHGFPDNFTSMIGSCLFCRLPAEL